MLDFALDGIVGARDEALGLELNVGDKIQRGALDDGMVAKLIFELANQNAASVHVGLCDFVRFGLICFGVYNVQELEETHALHHGGCRVAQKLGVGDKSAVDSNVVFGGYVKVGGLWRVVGCLFSNVVSFGAVRQVPPGAEVLAEDWVEGLFDSFGGNVPARKTPFDYLDEAGFGAGCGGMSVQEDIWVLELVGDALQHGLSLQDKGG